MGWMKNLICLICLVFASLSAEEFAFEGKHFVASYCDCNESALVDIESLEAAMQEAVLASGATTLGSLKYVFEPDGLTLVILLSESHASIHTYPEHGSCFVDLFTCGDNCHYEGFDRALRSYLQPKKVESRVLLRREECHDFSESS